MSQIQATITEYTQARPQIIQQNVPQQNYPQPQYSNQVPQNQPDVININPAIPRDILRPPEMTPEGLDDDFQEMSAEGLDQPQEDTEEKNNLIDEITEYEYSRFSERILEKCPDMFTDYDKCSNEELKSRIKICQTWILKKGAQKRVEVVFKGALNICDKSLSLLGFNVDGTSQLLCNDPDVLDTVEEIRLKRKSKMYTEPEYRLGFSILNAYMTTLNLHAQRENMLQMLQQKQIKDKVNEKLNEEVSNTEINNFEDL
jgi:hypothetical protein